MTLKKKLAFLIAPLVFILIGIFFAIFFTVPRLKYIYSEDYGGYLVESAYGDAKEYTIPKEYKGKKVVGIYPRAFYKHNSLEKVIFLEEENIYYVGRLAFSECKNLSQISIKYAYEVERNAFSFDEKLESIELSAKYIGASVFYGCSNLTNVTLNLGVKSIGSNCFSGCVNLLELKLPESVDIVYINCFKNSGLQSVLAPEHLKTQDYMATIDYVQYY